MIGFYVGEEDGQPMLGYADRATVQIMFPDDSICGEQSATQQRRNMLVILIL
jgi:hypothetical protein